MAFNFKAFATGFMGDQAKAINARLEKAEEYERELKEKADAGKSRIGKMRLLKDLGKTEIARLASYGAKPRHINAAIASGPDGLFKFSKNLTAEAQKRDVETFSPYEIDALVDMPESFQYAEMDSTEFFDRSHALSKPSLGSTKAPKRSAISRAMGFGLDDAVRADLDKEAYADGFSVMDINEISRQEAYESLSPGTFFTFNPTEKYNSAETQVDFQKVYEGASDISDSRMASIREQVEADNAIAIGDKDTEVQNRKNVFIQQRQMQIATSFADTYGRRFLEDQGIGLKEKIGSANYTLLQLQVLSEEELEGDFVAALLDQGSSEIQLGNTVKIGATNKNGENVEFTFVLDKDGTIKTGKENGALMPQEDMEQALLTLQDSGLLPTASVVRATTPTQQPTTEEEQDEDTEEALGDPPEVEESSDDPVEVERPAGSVKRKPETGNAARREWNRRYGDTHNEDGTPKQLENVKSKPKTGNTARREWNRRYGSTHNDDGTPKTDTNVEEPQETQEPDTETEGKTAANPITFDGMNDEEILEAFNNLPDGAYFINPADGSIKQK